MKRCPTCGQTFQEEWLSFCTQDGTSLGDTAALPPEPPPTIMAPPVRDTNPAGQPTLNLPRSYNPPPYSQPQPSAPVWQPPPTPRTAAPQQGMAIASLILGIFSMTIGWCCYLGVITAPIAIALGGYQLSQIKKDPGKFGGKPLALVGIVTGAAYFVFLVVVILIYGMTFLMHGIK